MSNPLDRSFFSPHLSVKPSSFSVSSNPYSQPYNRSSSGVSSFSEIAHHFSFCFHCCPNWRAYYLSPDPWGSCLIFLCWPVFCAVVLVTVLNVRSDQATLLLRKFCDFHCLQIKNPNVPDTSPHTSTTRICHSQHAICFQSFLLFFCAVSFILSVCFFPVFTLYMQFFTLQSLVQISSIVASSLSISLLRGVIPGIQHFFMPL